MIEALILYWALPSLSVLVIMTAMFTGGGGDLRKQAWVEYVLMAIMVVVWPLGMLMIIGYWSRRRDNE